MKKVMSILSLFLLMFLSGTSILSCKTIKIDNSWDNKIYKITKRVQDNIIEKNIRSKDKQGIIKNIKDNIGDIEDVYFEINNNIKEKDILIDVNIDKVNDKTYETTLKFFDTYKSNDKYLYKSIFSTTAEYSFLRKLDEIENIEVESNEITNSATYGAANLHITNYSKIETIYIKPIDNEDLFISFYIFNKNNETYISIDLKEVTDNKPKTTKLEISASNVKNKIIIKATSIYSGGLEIKTDISKVDVVWGEKFEIKVLNYSLISDLKIESDYDLQKINYDNNTGLISGYAIKNSNNNFLINEEFYFYLISDVYYRKLIEVSIKSINIFENFNKEDINLSTINKTYLKVNKNIDEITFSSLRNNSFDNENVVFENGNYTNGNWQVKYNKINEIILSGYWANKEKDTYVLVDSIYTKVINGVTYTQKIKDYRVHFIVTEWDKKLDIFSNKDCIKFESVINNKYLDYTFDDSKKEIKVFTNSNSIRFYIKNNFYRKINNLNDFYIENNYLVSLNSTYKGFPNKKIEYSKVNIITIKNIEEFKKAVETNILYKEGESNLNDYKLQIIYKES
ncbi:hypothetical protein [Spiroplasma tabanidicola]|uniref:Lipoprotein n=1 Tax=Spiroplasma tabanidicola TaxID=324079 RepID=A0A6I6CCX2_9MOLU|nr:hypothetical protein [Spiroplasma tabanidicola]QGS51824.1 hypothetical protein STABA_v1c04610 [Spiroplasma tabanidicola]